MNVRTDIAGRTRPIAHRTRGSDHGPITRLVSPSDLGQAIKPFIFLDMFSVPENGRPLSFGMHPHSGIATLTYLIHGQAAYQDTTGEHGHRGVLQTGGVEWMMAGGAVWHTSTPVNTARLLGFQLWVAMPPPLELATAYSIYLGPDEIQQVGPARVLLGAYGDHASRIPSPHASDSPTLYLAVHLKAGEHWRFEPPHGHTVAWAAVGEGTLAAGPDGLTEGDLVVFDASALPIDFLAKTDVVFMIGSAAPHPHDLVMGTYSVHTDAAALGQGEAHIRERARMLRTQGRM